jgi:hypothetical protein
MPRRVWCLCNGQCAEKLAFHREICNEMTQPTASDFGVWFLHVEVLSPQD